MYTYNAIVVRIIDGDTYEVDVDLGFKTWVRKSLRLARYDAPETMGINRSEAGIQTKSRVIELLPPGKHIVVVSEKYEDKYGRFLAHVLIDDENLGEKLFLEGLVKKYGDSA